MDFIYQLGGITKVFDGNLKVKFHNAEGDIEWALRRCTSTAASRSSTRSSAARSSS